MTGDENLFGDTIRLKCYCLFLQRFFWILTCLFFRKVVCTSFRLFCNLDHALSAHDGNWVECVVVLPYIVSVSNKNPLAFLNILLYVLTFARSFWVLGVGAKGRKSRVLKKMLTQCWIKSQVVYIFFRSDFSNSTSQTFWILEFA